VHEVGVEGQPAGGQVAADRLDEDRLGIDENAIESPAAAISPYAAQ